MQGDTIISKPSNDSSNTYFMYCKPSPDIHPSISDSLLKVNDSLLYKYFFNYAIKYNNKLKEKNQIITRPSFLTPHLLAPIHHKAQPINNYSTDWILITLLLCFSLFTWAYYSAFKRIKQIINAAFTNRGINQLTRDGDLFKERNSISLFIIYLLSFSLFLFQTSHYFINLKSLGLYNFIFFIKLFAGISLFILTKWVITRFIGFVFNNTVASNAFLLNSLIFSVITGLFLLPVDIFLFYANPVYGNLLILLGLLIILIFNTIQHIRYIFIGISYSKFSKFYLFLYLCTLELIPILILLKIFIGLNEKHL